MLNMSSLNPRAELQLRSVKAKLLSNTINRVTLSVLLIDYNMINAKIYILIKVRIAKYFKFGILLINLL